MLWQLELILIITVNVWIGLQFWFPLLKITNKFITHLFVLEVWIAILGLHVFSIEDRLAILDLLEDELALQKLLVQPLVTLVYVFSSEVSFEDCLLQVDFRSQFRVVLELWLFYW